MTAEPAPPRIGYRLVWPPGWARIPLRSGTEEAIEAILDTATAALPPDAPDVPERRAQVGAYLRDTVAAYDENCLHLYLPVEAVHGVVVPASFVVADIAFGSVDPLDPNLLIEGLTTGPGARRVTIAGTACSRTETLAPADPARGVPFPSRRVVYVLPVPADPDRWLVVTFSALRTDSDDDPSTVSVELFDAIMSTFRWIHT
ncbi:MAG TPA: hypothetical protein VGJ14_04305 [Sporichthyaceae bacterium]